MKLLVLTQVLDAQDGILGFFTGWVRELAQRVERVRVVALEVGDTSTLPDNVDWRVLGREGRLGRYLRWRRFLREALGNDGFDTVLAHMVPRYALLAAGEARRQGAGLHLWYTHGAVDRRLQKAVRLCDRVFTATPESMRVEAANKVVTGHGIDLSAFDPMERNVATPRRLVSVGRLTPSKDPLTVLAALSILRSRGLELELDLVGAGLTGADVGFRRTVEEAIEFGALQDHVHMLGELAHTDIPKVFRRATLLVNASLTGSLDKVVLESLAGGCPFVSCNPAATGLVDELGADARHFAFAERSAEELAERIEGWIAMGEARRRDLASRARAIVVRDHEVGRLMQRLVDEMERARESTRR